MTTIPSTPPQRRAIWSYRTPSDKTTRIILSRTGSRKVTVLHFGGSLTVTHLNRLAVVFISTILHEASLERNPDAPQQLQQPTTPGDHLGHLSPTGPKPRPFDAASQRPPFGGDDGNEDSNTTHSYIDNTYHSVSRTTDFTHNAMADLGTNGLSTPRPTTIPDMAQGVERGPQHAEEPAGEALPVDQGLSDSAFPALFQGVGRHSLPPVDYSATSHYPGDSSHILNFLKRGDGGRATCLWTSKGDTCGFFSHVDLVKRHIKRMHYCLK